MSTYGVRPGASVSHILRDLNTINPQDTTTTDDGFNMEDELSLFTNTHFFDFDSGQNMDLAQPVKINVESASPTSPSPSATAAPSALDDMPNLGFMQGEFGFPEFNNAYAGTPVTTFLESSQNFSAVQSSQRASQVLQPQAQPQQGPIKPADNRKVEDISGAGPQLGYEDASRQAAEEYKRRRNTAASARFRIKKKQREQALEKSAKEMTEKITTLESKVSQLETENKWLRDILIEKNNGSNDVTAMWSEFTETASEKSKAASSEVERTSPAREEEQ